MSTPLLRTVSLTVVFDPLVAQPADGFSGGGIAQDNQTHHSMPWPALKSNCGEPVKLEETEESPSPGVIAIVANGAHAAEPFKPKVTCAAALLLRRLSNSGKRPNLLACWPLALTRLN